MSPAPTPWSSIARGGLYVGALVVILCGHVDLVCGVAHPVLASEASLHLVGLLQCLVMNSLHQVADQLVHIETNSLDISFNDTRTVSEGFGGTGLFVLCVASSLGVRLALVLEHHLLDHVAVGVLVHTVAPHIGLPNIRIVALRRGRSWIFWR